MKRFKNISNLSDVNPGDKAFALSPKSVYSQTTPHMSPGGRIILPSPPPLPPWGSAFKGVPFPEGDAKFVERIRDAIKIAQGKSQIDEKIAASGSGILTVATFALLNLPKLNFLGPEMSKIANFVAASQLFTTAIILIKPKFRLIGVKLAGEDELKFITSKKYKINKHPMLEDPITKHSKPGPREDTVDMTLKAIADGMTEGKIIDNNHWVTNNYAYTFANPDDVAKIANMLDRNDFSNKIDSWISGLLPFISFGGSVAYIQAGINSARNQYKESGDAVIKSNPGVYQATTPGQRKNTYDTAAEYARRQRLQHSNPRKK